MGFILKFLTDFADQAVILPLAAAIALLLVGTRWWRGLAAWALTVGGVLGTVGVLKAMCVACAVPLAAIDLRSPSGHTASAAIVFGGMAILAAPNRRSIVVFAPLACAIVFGATRLFLQVHTVADVLAGGAVGIIGAAFLALLIGPDVPVRRWTWPLPLAVLLLLHGQHLPAEVAIRSWATNFIPVPDVCKPPT